MFFLENTPCVGFKMQYGDTSHKIVNIYPYVRKDGEKSLVFNWLSNCKICNKKFYQTSGLKGDLNKKCFNHRLKINHKNKRIVNKVLLLNGTLFAYSYEFLNNNYLKVKIFNANLNEEKKEKEFIFRNNFEHEHEVIDFLCSKKFEIYLQKKSK